jgi:hypothetical protein
MLIRQRQQHSTVGGLKKGAFDLLNIIAYSG